MRQIMFCSWLGLLVFGLSVPCQSRQQASNPTAAGTQVSEVPGQAGSQQELDAYRRLRSEVDPAVKRNLIDKFVAAYPDSGLLAYVYQEGAHLGRVANNVDSMAVYGAKSLERWPDNYALRTELGRVFVQRGLVDEAEAQANRALEIVAVAERPATQSEPQWEAMKKMLLAENHQTLGFVHLRRAQASQSATAKKVEADAALRSFRHALDFRPIDDFTYYGLGYACGILNDYAGAESNLAKSVAIDGVIMASARGLLEQIYRSRHNQILIGLDRVIAKARAELGLN